MAFQEMLYIQQRNSIQMSTRHTINGVILDRAKDSLAFTTLNIDKPWGQSVVKGQTLCHILRAFRQEVI